MIEIKTWQNGSEVVPAVDGRTLHKALDIGRDLSTWLNARIQTYGFEESRDYCSYLVDRGSRTPAREYLLSLPMSGELCLLEKTETSRQIRRFVLEHKPAQNRCENGKNCADNKPMELLTLDDLESYKSAICTRQTARLSLSTNCTRILLSVSSPLRWLNCLPGTVTSVQLSAWCVRSL